MVGKHCLMVFFHEAKEVDEGDGVYLVNVGFQKVFEKIV